MGDINVQRVKIRSFEREGPRKLSVTGMLSEGGQEKGSFRFYVLPEETDHGMDRLVDDIRAIQLSPSPYLWVRVIGEAHGAPMCVVAETNVWEQERAQRKTFQKYLSNMSRTFFALGILVGGVAGYFLGRRA